MDSSTEETVSQYKQQLSAVEKALKTSSDENKSELLDLKEKLTEVITLLDSNAKKFEDSLNKQISETSESDDEFLRFQKEISQLDKEASSNKQLPEDSLEEDETANVHGELYKVLSSMEGNKCRAPFARQWGERGYHNAIIFSTDLDDDIEDIKDVSVKVMFCNPICDEMKPCPYFLDGHCKFEEESCRYSHGYSIKYSDLEDYVLPNYSNVNRDSKCLVKYKDGLWYGAVVEKCLEKQQYCIKFNETGKIATVDAHDLLPLGQLSLSSDDDDSSSESSPERDRPADWDIQNYSATPSEINYQVEMGTSAMGEWEQHTKGIGSKLMAKMGYVWGQGLGKNSDGRLEPVEAIVLPKGKSLDTCVEMRGFAGPETVEDRFKSEQLKQEKIAKKLEQTQPNSDGSVFDFMNKNLGGHNDRFTKTVELSKKRSSTEPTSNNKSQGTDLNFEMYAVGEDIKKTKKEIYKLRESLKRNADRNESACVQMKQKMMVQTGILKKLEAKEQKISNEINAKKNHKKISIF